MVEKFKDITPKGEYFHGTHLLTKEAYLEVDHCSPVCIYGLNSSTPKGYASTLDALSSFNANHIFNVDATIILHGRWESPESWWAEVKSVVISQDNNILYSGDIVSGCTGDVYSKTNHLFINMSFIEAYFKKEIDAFITQMVDEWCLL